MVWLAYCNTVVVASTMFMQLGSSSSSRYVGREEPFHAGLFPHYFAFSNWRAVTCVYAHTPCIYAVFPLWHSPSFTIGFRVFDHLHACCSISIKAFVCIFLKVHSKKISALKFWKIKLGCQLLQVSKTTSHDVIYAIIRIFSDCCLLPLLSCT